MGWCSWWQDDPGPCPVDDTPHTACTPESLGLPAGTVVTVAYRPRVLPPLERTTVTFSTKEYRRAVHGVAVQKARQASTPARARPAPSRTTRR